MVTCGALGAPHVILGTNAVAPHPDRIGLRFSAVHYDGGMRVFLAMTGASGAIYGGRTLSALTAAGCEVGLCVSDAAAQVIDHEIFDLGPRPARPVTETLSAFVDRFADDTNLVEAVDNRDLASRYASGSAPLDGVVIVPCSMSTLATIATGTGRNLVHRAADVALKERRRLVLVARETPLSTVHLTNMLTVTQAGATVMPASPGFYNLPESIDDLVDFVVARTLDHLGVANVLTARWGSDSSASDAS